MSISSSSVLLEYSPPSSTNPSSVVSWARSSGLARLTQDLRRKSRTQADGKTPQEPWIPDTYTILCDTILYYVTNICVFMDITTRVYESLSSPCQGASPTCAWSGRSPSSAMATFGRAPERLQLPSDEGRKSSFRNLGPKEPP